MKLTPSPSSPSPPPPFPAVAGAGKVYLEDTMPKVSSTQVTIKVRKAAAFKVCCAHRRRAHEALPARQARAQGRRADRHEDLRVRRRRPARLSARAATRRCRRARTPSGSSPVRARPRTSRRASIVRWRVSLVTSHRRSLSTSTPTTRSSAGSQLRQFGGLAEFSGPIATVRCHEDNVLRQAASWPSRGTGGCSSSTAAARCGSRSSATWSPGSRRRTAGPGSSSTPACATSRCCGTCRSGSRRSARSRGRAARQARGRSTCPVEFGGITFRPGAMLTSDDDGIVVLDALA